MHLGYETNIEHIRSLPDVVSLANDRCMFSPSLFHPNHILNPYYLESFGVLILAVSTMRSPRGANFHEIIANMRV
jgi:hypothetical protein